MIKFELLNIPLEGKTYSLFGNSNNTEEYYSTIKKLADEILENNSNIKLIIKAINQFTSKKQLLRFKKRNPIFNWLNSVDNELIQYTKNTEEHLRKLSLYKKLWDRRLGTTRKQYHLYMLEIELTNRMYTVDFNRSSKKIALLPHCLQDFSVNCKSTKNGFDYQCRHCSGNCYHNHASIILKKNKIEPYIWMGGDLKQLVRKTIKNGQSVGILGIACIPELIWGMRKYQKYKIPVVGIPLNANRCKRWFGEFFPNSINLNELEKLISVSNHK